jgi:uncharacterized glyoxalase superfamily protein PhnB
MKRSESSNVSQVELSALWYLLFAIHEVVLRMATKPIPYGLHTVTPYVIVENAQALLDFVTKVFDAEQRELIRRPDGKIAHAEVTIGDSVIMLADKPPHPPDQPAAASAASPAAMPASLYVYVEDTDGRYKRALEAGAVSVMEPVDQFYGDRNAGVKDPTGNIWWIAAHIEDVSPDELARRAKAYMEQRKQ